MPALDALRRCPAVKEAELIGEIREQPAGTVIGATAYGGTRVDRHARGRSVAADLLDPMLTSPSALAISVENSLLRSQRSVQEFFSNEAHRLAVACSRDGGTISAGRPVARLRNGPTPPMPSMFP